VSHDGVLFGYRLRPFTLAEEIGVRPACRQLGVHHSTYYRWKRRVDRWGLEAVRVRERRRPRMPTQIGPISNSGSSPSRSSIRASAPGGSPPSCAATSGVASGSRSTATARCCAGWGSTPAPSASRSSPAHRDHYERQPAQAPPELHIDAREPGEKVQLNCFFIGRLTGTERSVWPYTAASGFLWAELHATDRNPRASWTASSSTAWPESCRRPAGGSGRSPPTTAPSFGAGQFRSAVETLAARQRLIKAGRPDSNSCLERAQPAILEDWRRPALARSLAPKSTDLDDYLHYFNYDRAHNGRLTQGRVPADTVFGAPKTRTVR
jgi:hypothetical protein